MKIAIDFDGTIALWNEFPNVGEVNLGAIQCIKDLYKNGHRLFIWTVRCVDFGMTEMLQFLHDNRILECFESVNYLGEQLEYSSSPKIDYDLLIDDKALGIPLKPVVVNKGNVSKQMYCVNWLEVRKLLKQKGFIKLV